MTLPLHSRIGTFIVPYHENTPMKPNVKYAPVSEATETLKAKGFTKEFSINDDKLVSDTGKHNIEDFEIIETYRYEGTSDPGDEATVYAIQSRKGNEKGILITGYGSSGEVSFDILQKLSDTNRI